ncbi:MAG: hypothetical protein RLN70_11995 [Rhodospirillaceae bacterium]
MSATEVDWWMLAVAGILRRALAAAPDSQEITLSESAQHRIMAFSVALRRQFAKYTKSI